MLRTSKEDITLALDSALPVNSIEENIYKDSKTEGKINILETLSTGKDEADIITNKVALNKVLNFSLLFWILWNDCSVSITTVYLLPFC